MSFSESGSSSRTRRQFLTSVAITAGSLAIAPLLDACSAPTSSSTAAPTAPAAGAAAPTAAAGGRVIPGQNAPGAAGQAASTGKTITLMHESSFVPAFDKFMSDVLAPEYEKQTGIKINYDTVSVGSLQPKVTSAAETNAGPETTLLFFAHPFLYDQKLVDLTDIADDLGKRYGGWHESARDAVVVNGKWKALPFGNVGQIMVYRADWFKEVGYDKFPETWDELLEAGTKLKAKGHPFGFEYGHGFGDNHGWMYPLLWSFGGREVDKDGKTVVLDSDETARAVDWARKFFEQANIQDVLGWTDVNNNKAFLGEQISCTNNASSILTVAKNEFPDIAPNIGHALNPKGPTGERFQLLNPWANAAFTFSANVDEAKKFLAWLHDEKQFSQWLAGGGAFYAPFLKGYENHPMWNSEPRMQPYKESVQYSHLPGWPAAADRRASESLAKYVICDMFAGAAQGKSPKEVIATATAQLKEIYSRAWAWAGRPGAAAGPSRRGGSLDG